MSLSVKSKENRPDIQIVWGEVKFFVQSMFEAKDMILPFKYNLKENRHDLQIVWGEVKFFGQSLFDFKDNTIPHFM